MNMDILEPTDSNNGVLVAGVVYTVMNQNYHISRNVRAQWFFQHLNKKVTFVQKSSIFQYGEDCEIEIVSVCPQDPPPNWSPETSHLYQYLVTPATNVIFLSHVSKAVYCLDMSPSISAVDIQRGEVMIDQIVVAVRNSIEGVVKPFVVPGSVLVFEPDLFVTVIVHTPFFTTPAQQGWRVTAKNVEEFLCAIVKQLERLEDTIANVSGLIHDQLDALRMKQAESERLVGGLFEEPDKVLSTSTSCNISMVGPDLGFINLLRYGMLALRLLPPNNLSNLVVVTDGMITLPDIDVLDSVLSQLRSNAVAVSFLHIGSQFHPHCCHGLVPYSELMQFITSATLGAYIPSPPCAIENKLINIYHEMFITWSFRKRSVIRDLTTPIPKHGDWNISNQSFYGNREPQLLTKKHIEENLNVSLFRVLFCRLHEGYMIKNVHMKANDLEVTMVLPWSNHIFIEYIITAQWPEQSENLVHYILSIKAPYEFLHDITCLMKKRFHSPYRQAVVSRFWSTLKTLSHTDLLLSRLDSFSTNPVAFTLPDGIRSGMPLFYPPTNASPPVLSSSGASCLTFAQFWRPVVMLEPSVWQKWFHTHRLGVILQPDRPIPLALYAITNNTRIQVLQCRQAAAALFNSLKKITTFVLIENHSYIKIITPVNGDKEPNWFSIIRVTMKPPCAVIHIAFLGGTPGTIRHQVIEAIKEEISQLKIPQRCDIPRKHENPVDTNLRLEVQCCTLLQKPLEKILIRYERMPCEFRTVVFPDGTQPVSAAKPLRPTSTLITTLSRYLHHKRSIWDAHTPSVSHNNSLPIMLTTLTKMRLQEGFRFAHCTAGIINMVLEVQMKCFEDDKPFGNAGKYQPCIVQYVLFPPHMTSVSAKGSNSGDEGADEADVEVRTELITECWIEPQHGVVTQSPPHRYYLENLQYHQIADMIWRVDVECISNLLTFDHLQLMCHNQEIMPPAALDPLTIHQNPLENWPHAVALEDDRIHRIPFAYNLMNILNKCQQAEVLSSMFIQELNGWENKCRQDAPNNSLMESFLNHLQELNHRELYLSDHESTQLLQLIMARTRDTTLHPIPFPTRLPNDSKPIKQFTKLPFWRNKELDHRIPKWRCFIKSMASTHCVLTFVPASYHDLKILMLGAHNKKYISVPFEDNVSYDSQEYESKLECNNTSTEIEKENYSVNVPDILCNSKANSVSSNKRWTVDTDDDSVFDNSSRDIIKDFLSETPEHSAFRVRSSSWDTMKEQPEHPKINPFRIRTSSVGSKMKTSCESKRMRVANNESSVSSLNTLHHPSKKILGAVTLPIYIYNCPLANLEDALIFKSNFVQKSQDIFLDRTSKIETPSSFESENEEESPPDEFSLHHHCKVVAQAFNKCFTITLFKSLHLGHSINSLDIQQAVNGCVKTLLEIDITKYIQTVCGHYKKIFSKDTGLSLSLFHSDCLSHEMRPLHYLIKERFLEILTFSFKPVPSNPDYYFCYPPFHHSRAVDVAAEQNRRVVESQEYDMMTLQSDILEYNNSNENIIGGWERAGYIATPDDARTSLLSNMDSESMSDFPEDDINDEISPLFLHLVCSVQSKENNFFLKKKCEKIIPTCLGELFDDCSVLDDFILDPSSFTICLNMYFLTLPLPCLEDLPTKDSECHYSEQEGLMTASEQQFTQVEHRLSSDQLNEKLKNLPGLQHKSINLCIQEIKWLLQDEIATFLLEEYPVAESTLSFVASHVESSSERYSCILHTLNLDFVSGIDHSIGKFEQELEQMKVPGYHLKKKEDFYYVVKASDETVGPKVSRQTNWNGLPLNFLSGGDSILNSAGQLTTSLIGSGNFWESDFKGLMDSNSWIMDINQHRINLPNFWLILKVEKDEVISYFHCRFLEINCDEVQHYREIHARVLESIDDVCKTVNQTLLLQNLYNTRICDPLLEPETNDDIWKPNQSIMNRAKSLEDGVDDINETYLENVSKFLPGCFSCSVVWQAHFLLHPRLKTGPGKTGLSRAIQALRTVLNRFSVNNRTNMFVYQDSTGSNVFYLRLQENIKCSVRQGGIDDDSSPGSVSRSSSINSLNNKKPPDENHLRDMRPRLKSFGEMIEREYSKQEDFLTLKVHGITEAGAEVKNELVQVLQNRLDDAVLEVLSVMLARNPMCKLSVDDVYFIQKPNHVPDTAVQFTIPEYAYKHLQALSYYLRQNMLQFLFLPKYTDPRYQFQDFSEPEGSSKRIPDSTIYLYNQSPASGSKGIACLAIGVLDSQRNVIRQAEFTRPGRNAYEEKIIDISQFQTLTFTKYRYLTVDPCEIEADPDAVVEVRLWKQGRVNMESLLLKLKSAVQFSLWDLNMEFNFLTAPLSNQPAGRDIITLHKVYYNVIPLWLQYGNELSVPSVRMNKFGLTSRHAVGVTLKEVHTLVKSYESSSYLFCENAERTSALVYQCGSEFLSSGRCFLIACHPSLWRLTIDADSSHSEIEGKGQKSIQKFPQCFNTLPDGTMQYVPRQRFLIALINNHEVSLYTYNWAKERVESLIKSLTQLGLWLSARSSFLTGILTQKMGLFHNQPYTRKSTPQLNSPDGTELESLLVFTPSVAVKKSGYGSLAGLTQILHDSKPLSFRRRSSDPVTANVYQIVEIRSNENREQQKKLYMMWQSRGATPNVPLTEDILDLFMQYSRIIHYCLTPLLFLPQWRLQSAATRDHSLKVHNTKLTVTDIARHQDDKWHQSLCANFVNEYKQYLQTLGFIPIQIAPSTPRKMTRTERNSKSDEKPVCYLQKSLLGGILLFEILLSEPFFHAKLHALECSRLQSTPTSSLVSQFTKNFLDECDKVKVLMHLHSFTYDYHLRCLHWYISDRQSLLRPDYHLTSFLDDFLKYYPKAPNYARSLAYSGSLSVPDLITPATQLFDYLLSHGKVYEMEVLRMLPLEVAPTSESSQPESEYVLVKLGSTRHVTYKDAQDLNQTDDFDVTLIVSYEETTVQMMITLNYYILVTSRRELYPKLEIEQKLGKFCTVSTANPLSSLQSSAESLGDVFDSSATVLKSTESSQQHVEIKQESVNYLGYYSSHEQLMQQLIMEEAAAAKMHIEEMIKKGSVDCRTHILWNKLLSTLPTLTYSELFELKELAHVQSLLGLDSRLSPMLTQPVSWYQGLMKILIAKYADRHRIFTSPDNNTQHLLILHQKFLNGFVMLTIDSFNLSGDLSIVYRQIHEQETDITTNDIHSLVEGVVNACCFHIWISLLT